MIQAHRSSTIEYACDIRFHQSFKLPPNPDIGRNAPIRVSYSDTGKLDSPLQERYISTGPRIGIASKIIVEKDNIATAEAPSNAFIPGSLPSEESVDAVTHEQGEAGASSNDVLKFNDGRKDECLDQPVVLFCGGMFGGRYQAMSTATLAEEYGIRLIIVDRPGIGGSEKVPLKQRLQTWLGKRSDIVAPSNFDGRELLMRYPSLCRHGSSALEACRGQACCLGFAQRRNNLSAEHHTLSSFDIRSTATLCSHFRFVCHSECRRRNAW